MLQPLVFWGKIREGESYMALSTKQTQDICLVYGGHKACRYLVFDQESSKYLCSKLVKTLKDQLDERIDEYLSKMKKNGQDPATMGRAIGDNCQGYIFLKYKKQGYDVDKA
jgi:hypothetical protein